MKTVVIYYSFRGHTKAEAEKIASGISAEIIEIKEAKKEECLVRSFPDVQQR